MRSIHTLAILLTALTASAQSTATFEWKGAIQPNQTLEIRNINGNINAEAAPGPDAAISVRIVGTRPDPSTIKIDVVEHDGGLLFCTIYVGLSRPDHCTPQQSPSLTLNDSDIRVTYTVQVPADVHFTPRTINGNISADLPGSPVSAATVNGRIVLTAGKPVNAHVVNGTILATLAGAEWEGSREFAAVNGTVDVQVPAESRLHVRASNVWGSLTNDFGIQLNRNLIGSWFEGDINGGGPRLVLGTVNGSIHLRRPPVQ